LQKIKRILNTKYKLTGGSFFTFSLPGGAARTLSPPSVTPLSIGYIGLIPGPQDPRGPPANCGTQSQWPIYDHLD